MTKAEMRMQVLKNSGADMSKYFVINLPTGDDMLMEMVDGVPTPAKDSDDPVLNQIYEDGYVRNTMLHRRFVLAQMWSMLNYKGEDGGVGYDAALKANGYDYQWRVLLEEIRVLSKLETRDEFVFNQRSNFFGKHVVIGCCHDYVEKLTVYVNGLKKKYCKGIAYKTIGGEDIFVSDLNKKLYNRINGAIYRMSTCQNYNALYVQLRLFIKNFVKKYRISKNSKMCPDFVSAYKGAGAYYSLRNLIQFHNCGVEDKYGFDALVYIDAKVEEYKMEGYKLLAVLKKCITDNNWTPSWR